MSDLTKVFYDYIHKTQINNIQAQNTQNSHRKNIQAPIINYYRSILALNGELPEKHFFTISKGYNLPIIAADGAVNQLIRMQIVPNVVIGDLDSFTSKSNTKLNIIYDPDQDYCDFYKSMNYLSANSLLPTIIVGIGGGTIDHILQIGGGTIDHILQNVSIFIGTNSMFYDQSVIGHSLNTATVTNFSLPINTKISLFGMQSATISTHGLK